jgi:hypothetical protein
MKKTAEVRTMLQGFSHYHLDDVLDDFLNCSDNAKTILLQPVAGYYEQFKRMKDILPKLFNSVCMIDTSYRPPVSDPS